MDSFPHGILLVDKPQGVTSFAVVGRVRHVLQSAFPARQKMARGPGGRPPRFRCGHAGTLDPLATGLLIVLVGRGSRLAPFLLGLDKTYSASVRFGTETDTLDAEGQVVLSKSMPTSIQAIKNCLPQFRGEIQQVPPVYSALKRGGKSLCRLARAGLEVPEPEPRTVVISRLEIADATLSSTAGVVDLVVDCGSGTYIRSLARDLGRATDSAAHLEALRRTRIGPFPVAAALGDAMSLESEVLKAALIPLAAALPHLPRLELSRSETQRVLQGGQPEAGWLDRLVAPEDPHGGKGDYFTMTAPDGKLMAVGEVSRETGIPSLAAVVGKEGDACD